MFSSDQYELIDFGASRKLERYAGLILNRPSPSAHDAERAPFVDWDQAHGAFERREGLQGDWSWSNSKPNDSWTLSYELDTTVRSEDQRSVIRFNLRATPAGQLGVFPEQCTNWDWIYSQVQQQRDLSRETPRVLNLFAYTGGSTLAAALAGAEVVHIDSARNVVAWARKNAIASGIPEAPVRWIAEDAPKFVLRELKRKRTYDGIILDPPSYGHGPRGQEWIAERDMETLVDVCLELLRDSSSFLLVTSHTPEVEMRSLARLIESNSIGDVTNRIELGEMNLTTSNGRALHSGVFLRLHGEA